MIDPDKLKAICEANGYLAPQITPDNRWLAIAQFIYTAGILHGTERDLEIGPSGRFCYHNIGDAAVAMAEWKDRDFKDKPLNYITEK